MLEMSSVIRRCRQRKVLQIRGTILEARVFKLQFRSPVPLFFRVFFLFFFVRQTS